MQHQAAMWNLKAEFVNNSLMILKDQKISEKKL